MACWRRAGRLCVGGGRGVRWCRRERGNKVCTRGTHRVPARGRAALLLEASFASLHRFLGLLANAPGWGGVGDHRLHGPPQGRGECFIPSSEARRSAR